ncbi:MAG: hypothetical protein A3G34_15915 [Candidatus Lindowbacteria bacterium RIFCSPLOWO2_12_FULL_62_27]|nr:MAG: hypothetical protein A3G34_15915 [Candidatus Lindowbacteria bacterium RIFCSPLOWO2_12_FULL_62_27]OGH63673.1 MAG: hypothetical protein A3I06_06805 [Candidatus Lindowbacteria bacterium RIFCSPLOWO2_02_FULL_62_12]
MLKRLTQLSVDHPRAVLAAVAMVSVLFGMQFPKVTVDTDPKHMLPETSPVRRYNDQVERDFALHADVIVVGIVNPHGVFNPQTLGRVAELTRAIQSIPGVVARDVASLSATDNVTSANGDLIVKPPLAVIPASDVELAALRRQLLDNPLFVNRLISDRATATVISVPLEPGVNGKEIADKIRAIFPQNSGDDVFHLAGDPIARDTFGAEMFRQMAFFSPFAGAVICLALWLMFRNVWVIAANMAVAMISIVWSMGGLIGLGFPVHIMSSMSPVFLMAIATDAVHILNEFAFRAGGDRDVAVPGVGVCARHGCRVPDGGCVDRRQAALDTMAVVGPPVFYSDITTAVGFAALAAGDIVPVKIFGLVVGFGTLVVLLMSYTLVPAMLMLVPAACVDRLARRQNDPASAGAAWLTRLGGFCVRRTKPVLLVGLAVILVAGAGLARIRVNNNMVHWFKPESAVRSADRILNEHLGGTSTAYIVVQARSEGAIGDPAMLTAIERLQRELERDPLVGKTVSIADYIRRANRVLHDDDPSFDRIPESAGAVGQILLLLSSSAKPRDIDNVVDFPLKNANIMIQLKTWDADAMNGVIGRANAHLAAHPLPDGAQIRPAGIAYFNTVWNHEVLRGMLESFLWGLGMVWILLVIQMRSALWGCVCFLPLLATITVIYGVVGWIGKDFDMPVAVLSTLTLGMAVDFAIHFVGRFRQRLAGIDTASGIDETLIWTVSRPGRGVICNAILFASGFLVMIFADLTPYITVGVLMAAIMLLSSAMSLVYLPALIRLLRRQLIGGEHT